MASEPMTADPRDAGFGDPGFSGAGFGGGGYTQEPAAPETQSASGGVLATTFWAIASLGVFVGALVWAYGLGVRNPADVPALQAAAESYKARPAEAGGLIVPERDRAIYDAVSGAEPTDPEFARSTSSPERPTPADIAAAGRDVSSDALVALVADAVRDRDAPANRRVVDLDFFDVRPGSTGATLTPTRPEYPANLGRGAEPLPPGARTDDPTAEEDTTAAAARVVDRLASAGGGASTTESVRGDAPPAPAPSGGIAFETPPAADGAAEETATAPAPASRDATAGAPAASPAPVEAAPTPAPVPAPVSTPAASVDGRIYQIQLAALETPADVRTRWGQVQSAHRDLLGRMQLDIQPVSVGGAELFRLRLDGAADRGAAARVCSELRSRGVDCFVALKR